MFISTIFCRKQLTQERVVVVAMKRTEMSNPSISLAEATSPLDFSY